MGEMHFFRSMRGRSEHRYHAYRMPCCGRSTMRTPCERCRQVAGLRRLMLWAQEGSAPHGWGSFFTACQMFWVVPVRTAHFTALRTAVSRAIHSRASPCQKQPLPPWTFCVLFKFAVSWKFLEPRCTPSLTRAQSTTTQIFPSRSSLGLARLDG